ncbi:hypothetical protein IQ265_10405 [Nodosilinea sp. LEGE 06152]|uniref:hypothetical protein n=1 Tax=Nodosilinea sp. LEGE 06152 TaxID=2777966 RepID=UPI00187FDE7B|nr:hypothetical protein [Nodosilinea sp. LEGE 06152]MBE9157230.1 hypothetical protein [Nodosilinea sp. LEGE 06152]
MLFYIRIPKHPRQQGTNQPPPQSPSVLAQNQRIRHHQATVKTLHQRTQEKYLLERRWLV